MGRLKSEEERVTYDRLSSGNEAHHPGKGSIRGLILNLMVDHGLLFHPAQLARIENKLPAYTVGSLTEKIKVVTLRLVLDMCHNWLSIDK